MENLPITRRRFLRGAGALGAATVARGVDRGLTGELLRDARKPKHHRETVRYHSAPHLHPPVLKVVTKGLEHPQGLLFLAPKGGTGQYGPMIADDRGHVVWFHPVSGPWSGHKSVRQRNAEVANNFRVSQYKGKPVLTWWQGQIGLGASRYVVVDDHYRQIATFKAGNGMHGDQHEFIITADDTALVTFTEPVPANLSSVGGPSNGAVLDGGFQRIDIATGEVLFQWTASKHVTYWESYRPITTQGTQSSPWDFFHINSVDVDTDGNYLVSSRHTWTVYKIDQLTGAIIWRLNGKRSDFRVGHKAHFSWQHDARPDGSGMLTLFDDGAGVYRTASHSRGLTLSLDETAMTARMAEQYLLGDVLSWSQGSMQTLSNGHVVVGWGSQPYISEYTHGGRVLLKARLPERSQSYRAFRFPWTGRPHTSPAVAVDRRDGSTRVYASWNGATEVAHWRVLAGERAEGLRPVHRVKAEGFETVIHLPHAAKDHHFAAVALDAKGRALARSKTVRLR